MPKYDPRFFFDTESRIVEAREIVEFVIDAMGGPAKAPNRRVRDLLARAVKNEALMEQLLTVAREWREEKEARAKRLWTQIRVEHDLPASFPVIMERK